MFTHEDDFTASPNLLKGCRCGEVFYETHTIKDTDDSTDFDIAFEYDLDTGDRTGISYGALTGFPTTFHETFEYNTDGQITKRTHPDNGSTHTREDDFTYYTMGTQTGYLETAIVDNGAGGLALTTSFEYDAVGNVKRYALPREHALGITAGLDDVETSLIYNSNDELIRWQSRKIEGGNNTRNLTDIHYDANGNVTEIRVKNRDETGVDYSNADIIDTYTYDSLNRRTQTVAEIDATTNATSTIAYNRNGLPILITSPESVAGNDPRNRQHLQYDERDLLYRSIRGLGDPNQITTQFDYDKNGNLETQSVALEEASANQRVTSFVYDEFDRLTKTTDPEGNTEELDYNGADQVIEVILKEGGTTRLAEVDMAYDVSGRRTLIDRAYFDESGTNVGDGLSETDFTYTDSFQIEEIDFEGNTLDYVYDTVNRVDTITDAKSNVREFAYDDNSSVTSVTETDKSDLAAGDQVFLTEFEYDRLDRLTKRRLRYSTASGGLYNDALFDYDSRNNLVLQTDARTHDRTFAYDGLSRRTSSTFELSPGGSTVATSTAYDLNSRVATRTDPNGNVTTYSYDSFDRLAQVTYADGTAVAQTHERFGDLDTRTDPAGTEFSHTYDKLSRLTERTITPATGFDDPGTETFAYDGLSRLTDADDSDSEVDFVYDSLNHLVSETLKIDAGTARATAHSYNANDGTRSQTVYPGTRTLDFTFDALDRLSTIADTATTLTSYDYIGRRVERRTFDDNGTQLDYTWNGIGSANAAGDFGFRRIAQTAHTVTSGGAVLDDRGYLWDADQNKLQRDDLRSGGPQLTHDYVYDGRSRMTSQDDGTTVTSFTYDAAGNRTDTGYTLDGSDALTNNYSTIPSQDRGYDLQGNLSSFDARAESYTFDVHNRLSSYVTAGTRTEETPNPGSGWTDIGGGTWSVTDGVLTESTATTARLLRDTAFATSNETFTFSYRSPHDPDDATDYDPERYGLALLRVIDSPNPAPAGAYDFVALVLEPTGIFLREWANDTLVGELVASSEPSEVDTWYDLRVAYSGTNNTDLTVSRAKRGQPFEVLFNAVTVGLAEDSSQQIGFGVGELGDYEFKDVQFTDATDTDETVEVTFQYDALGRRIKRTVDPDGTPVATEFYYDGPHVVEERDGVTTHATYVYGRGLDELLSMDRSSTDYYYHADDLGNVFAVTNGSGAIQERYDYGAYGLPSFFDSGGSPLSATAIGNDYLFNSRRCDPETGLYYYRTRYLDPTAGRFISRDTIGLYGDANNLGNGQAYVGNNPWTKRDPFGEFGGYGPTYELDSEGNYQFAVPSSDSLRGAIETGRYAPSAYAGAARGLGGSLIELRDALWDLPGTIRGMIEGGKSLATSAYRDPAGTTRVIGDELADYVINFDVEDAGAMGPDLLMSIGSSGFGNLRHLKHIEAVLPSKQLELDFAQSSNPPISSDYQLEFGFAGEYRDAIPSGSIRARRNSQLAGSNHPVSGIPFDSFGFPDFSQVSIRQVDIQFSGSRAMDIRRANRAAGISSLPKGYVWHHHQNLRTMQLVPDTLHRQTGHDGGFTLWNELYGDQ